MGSWRGLPRPRQTLLLPQKPWLSLSPGRPSERGLYKGLQPCPVLGRLLAGDSEPGQPGVAAAGERHPVCESWSGKQPGAQGWRRHSGGGWQSSHGPSCPRVARPAMQASIRRARPPGLRVRAAAAQRGASRAAPGRGPAPRERKVSRGSGAASTPRTGLGVAARSRLGLALGPPPAPAPQCGGRRHPEQSASPGPGGRGRSLVTRCPRHTPAARPLPGEGSARRPGAAGGLCFGAPPPPSPCSVPV